MNKIDPKDSLPALGIAAIIGSVVLLLFILPAEYGVDPTGFGGAIGLTHLSESNEGGTIHTAQDVSYRNDSIEVYVAPGAGLEYKFIMQDGAGMIYSWRATGPLYYDFHGEPSSGDTFQSYEVETNSEADGSFTAPFEGTHGWYWRNDSAQPIRVTLETAGHYEIKGVV